MPEPTARTATALPGVLDRFFEISQRGSTPGREVRGGLVTFVTMAYIVVLNPLIIGSFVATDPGAHTDVTGAILPVPQVAAATALVAGVMTILFGLVANYPFALATGLGINTLVAVTIAPLVSWPEAMGLVVVNGLVVLLLVVTGVRTAVFNAVPAELKAAIAAGIGLFICFIGLVDAGFVRRLPDAAGTTVPVGLGINGSIASWPTAVFVTGLRHPPTAVGGGRRVHRLLRARATACPARRVVDRNLGKLTMWPPRFPGRPASRHSPAGCASRSSG